MSRSYIGSLIIIIINLIKIKRNKKYGRENEWIKIISVTF